MQKLADYKLVVGLGNIGSSYQNSRHNLGFIFVDLLRSKFGFNEFALKNSNYFLSSGFVDLMKPATYMNNSGLAVLSYLTKKKCASSQILVIHDELNLKEGEIKFKIGGGHGGHNGLRSISNAIGSEYHRIRLGIGRPEGDVAHYVLQSTDLSIWNERINVWCEENKIW
ncbi:MAG: aminoacyl-tRNA hydrolase [Alphaproteobacteria bacterium]|nr:MAG: aminoacyl-tRNA hydrolase [Alphaproteobacteria bacterium]